MVLLAAVPWTYRFQRPQQLAMAFAAQGRPVLYVEAFDGSRLRPSRWLSQVAPGVHRLEVRLPTPADLYRQPTRNGSATRVAELVAAGLPRTPGAVMAQLPGWGPVARRLADSTGAPLVYDLLDLHTGFASVPADIVRVEADLVGAADLVTVTATALAGQARRLGAAEDRILLVPNGVEPAHFSPADSRPRPPVIGYVGALAEWFDVDAVARLAKHCPHWPIRLAGRVENDAVAGLATAESVELLGEIPYASVAPFLAGLSVLVIPFQDTPLTRAVDPVKLYEAFATGLPVVARRLPELERWSPPLVYLYDDAAELPSLLERALEEDSGEASAQRREHAEAASWTVRAASLLEGLERYGQPVTPSPRTAPRDGP